MKFLDKIKDMEEDECSGFEEDLLKDRKEEEEKENTNNENLHDDIIENHLIN